MIIYIFAIYFNASYYLPDNSVHIMSTDYYNWYRPMSLIQDVTISEIKKVISIPMMIVLGLFYFIMIFFSSFLKKHIRYSILFLTVIAIGLIFTYPLEEGSKNSWSVLYAHTILLTCVLFTIYLYYKESKLS